MLNSERLIALTRRSLPTIVISTPRVSLKLWFKKKVPVDPEVRSIVTAHPGWAASKIRGSKIDRQQDVRVMAASPNGAVQADQVLLLGEIDDVDAIHTPHSGELGGLELQLVCWLIIMPIP
jgi:hypothetical protein